MTTKNQSFDYAALVSELENQLNATIGITLRGEVQFFEELTDKFIQRLDEYNSKTKVAIMKGSRQAVLFENASFSRDIFLMLEDSIKEKPTFSFSELVNSFAVNAYKQLELIPENDEFSELIRVVRDKKKKRSTFFNSSKRKANQVLLANTSETQISGAPDVALTYLKAYPNRNFFFYYLVFKNLEKQSYLQEKIYSNIVELLNLLWSIDKTRIEAMSEFDLTDYNVDATKDQLVVDAATDEIKKHVDEIKSSVDLVVNGLNSEISSFVDAFSAANILEQDDFKSSSNIGKECVRQANTFGKIQQNWQNSIFLLAEDWKLDAEMNSFRIYILKQFFNFSQVINTRFTSPVEEIIQSMNSALEELNTKVTAAEKKSEDEFLQHFKDAKADFKRKFRLKIIPALKDIIIKSEIPKAVDTIEMDTSSTFNDISDKRIVTNKSEYKLPIERSEFQSISPRVLVGYELMPQLQSVFPNLKTSFIRHVQSFEKMVEEIPGIIDFTVESSISYFEKDGDAEESIKITAEGIGRAENKLEEISGLHTSFITTEVETLKISIDQFVKEIATIASSESAFKINLRIVKLQAIAKSNEIRQNITKEVKSLLPHAVSYIRQGSAFLWQSSEKIGKQFKVYDKPQFITSETSDYLAATEIAINRLPYIYQRLFKNEPLTSFELFVGREKPSENLFNAYLKWKDERFAPVVIIGEKGSGKTTLLNWFLKTKTHNEKVIYLDLHEVNKTPELIYNEIVSLVEEHRQTDSKGLSGRKTIFALDGLARLFNSEVNGFNYLIKTMKLISETNSQIFWIVSSHLYTWYYIDKSFNISDYFAYHIKLTDIGPNDLKRIILRRHNISGFRLVYESLPSKKKLLSTKKMINEKQQAELEDAYFRSLTAFNNNNLSQAFLYWLRSTSQLKDDVIYIRQISEIKNNFIKSISLPKMISLRSILVHNGITIEGHASKFSYGLESSKLHLDQMLDDGLLIKKQDYYLVNPLIYSQIIHELYLLNLLH